MKKTITLLALISATTLFAETSPEDYLDIGNQIQFNGAWYELKWSDYQASANYYKQEYLQKGTTLDDYNEMITVDVLNSNIGVDKALQIKVAELTELKKRNPIVNFDLYQNDEKNKFFLDFVLTDGGDLYEWNLYQYMTAGRGSKRHLILTAYTYRDKITSREKMLQFFGRIKTKRSEMLEALDKVTLPEMKLE